MLKVEILLASDLILRAEKMLNAMIAAAPIAGVDVIVSKSWQNASPVLMSYGLGHPVRRGWTEAHKRNGGTLIGWDLGYWLRDVKHAFSMRCTINDDHPHRWIRPEDPSRWDRAGIDLREDYDPAGPIVLVGMGRKQCVLMGIGWQDWERKKLQELKDRFPDRRIIYRPKRETDRLDGAPSILGPIEDVLRGASLVVCHHSNVAVDACIAGVPVECSDGAAFALYAQGINPTREQRLDFLRSLAWWQWTPLEAVAAWDYLGARIL